jgi:hypothetical protein
MRPELAPVRLHEPAQQAVEDVTSIAADRGVSVHNDVPGGLSVRADAGLLARALVNLLLAAVRAAPRGGEAWIKAIAGPDGWVKVSVNDTGEPVPAEIRDRVFDLTAAGEDEPRGLARLAGPGLAYCRMAVEAMGGRIGMDAEPGRGVSCWFTLPGSAAADGASGSSAPDPAAGRLPAEIRSALKPLLRKLRGLDLTRLDEIRKLLAKTDAKDPAIRAWRKSVEDAAFACDAERYRSLLE